MEISEGKLKVFNAFSETTALASVIAVIMEWAPAITLMLGAAWWLMKLVISWPDLMDAIDRIRARRKGKAP